MCLILPEYLGAAYLGADGQFHAVRSEVHKEKEAGVQNKILMQCCGDQCQVTKELDILSGKPVGWFAVDVQGPGAEKKISMVLCPGCFAALGIKIPTVKVEVK